MSEIISSHSIKSHSIKSEIKGTLALGLPLIASQLVYACSGFISTAMVARLGQNALAASVLVGITWFGLLVLFIGILNAIGILVSHQYGAKNYKAISEIMGQSHLLGLLIAVPILLVLSSMPWLIQLSDQPAAVLSYAKEYAYSLLWTTPALISLMISEQFLAGIGKSKIILRISLTVVPVEIALIYGLIFGKWGLPACGIAGVGYGFATTWTITAVSLICLFTSKKYQEFGVLQGILKANWKWLKELFRVGLPIGCVQVIDLVAFITATFFIGHFGVTMLAAHQIVMQYLNIAVTLIFAMSQAVTMRVGYSVGKQDIVGVKYAAYVGMVLNVFCMLIVIFIFNIFPNFLLSLDLNMQDIKNATLIDAATILLSIVSVFLLFENFRLIGMGVLRGLKDMTFPMYISLFSVWGVGIFSALWFAFILHGGSAGIWWGLTAGMACGAALVLLRLRYVLRRVDLQKLMEIK